MIKDIFNLRMVSSQYWTAGQPSEEQLGDVAKEGFDLVLNIAPQDPRYSLEDEERTVKSLGMAYRLIPIDFRAPTLEDYDRVEAALLMAKDKRVFIHCAANYRVTTIFGCFAVNHLGWSQAEWDAFIADVWDISEFPVWTDYKAQLKHHVKELVK